MQDADGSVTGAICQGPDGYVRINASKGVVVCTGGYARNLDMLQALQPQTMDKYSLSIAIPGTTGDGIKACLWAGAHMDEAHTAMVFDRVAVKPDELGGSQTEGSLFWMGSNPWLKVNLNGERFANEAAPYDYILNAALTQQADTIEELVEKLGIPADNLVKTVERQNENYDNGVDPDFSKDQHRLSAIRTAPFFGVRTSGYMLCTLDGITINEQFQAVRADGSAIEGLYVGGCDSGSYYAHTYPNMSTGNCCGRSVTFARMIGKALAAK